MSEQEAFLAAALECPSDPGPWGIWADHLEQEQGRGIEAQALRLVALAAPREVSLVGYLALGEVPAYREDTHHPPLPGCVRLVRDGRAGSFRAHPLYLARCVRAMCQGYSLMPGPPASPDTCRRRAEFLECVEIESGWPGWLEWALRLEEREHPEMPRLQPDIFYIRDTAEHFRPLAASACRALAKRLAGSFQRPPQANFASLYMNEWPRNS